MLLKNAYVDVQHVVVVLSKLIRVVATLANRSLPLNLTLLFQNHSYVGSQLNSVVFVLSVWVMLQPRLTTCWICCSRVRCACSVHVVTCSYVTRMFLNRDTHKNCCFLFHVPCVVRKIADWQKTTEIITVKLRHAGWTELCCYADWAVWQLPAINWSPRKTRLWNDLSDVDLDAIICLRKLDAGCQKGLHLRGLS